MHFSSLSHHLAVLFALGTLTACGGAGSSVSADDPMTEAPSATDIISVADINSVGANAGLLQTALDAGTLRIDTVDQLTDRGFAQTGAATYQGAFFGDMRDTNQLLVGATTLEVSFANGGSVTGTAQDFALIETTNATVAPRNGQIDLQFTGLDAGIDQTAVTGTVFVTGGQITQVPGRSFGALDTAWQGDLTFPAGFAGTTEARTFTLISAIDLSAAEATDNTVSALVGEGTISLVSGSTFIGLDGQVINTLAE